MLPADLSVVPLKELQSAIAKKQVEIEELKKRGQVNIPPYPDAVKLLPALREQAKNWLKEKQRVEKEEKRKIAEAALPERRAQALADPDHYERYLNSAKDRAWWKNEGLPHPCMCMCMSMSMSMSMCQCCHLVRWLDQLLRFRSLFLGLQRTNFWFFAHAAAAACAHHAHRLITKLEAHTRRF